MSEVQVEQKSYQMPPQDGITIAHFLTVADVERSLRFYETVFSSGLRNGHQCQRSQNYPSRGPQPAS